MKPKGWAILACVLFGLSFALSMHTALQLHRVETKTEAALSVATSAAINAKSAHKLASETKRSELRGSKP